MSEVERSQIMLTLPVQMVERIESAWQQAKADSRASYLREVIAQAIGYDGPKMSGRADLGDLSPEAKAELIKARADLERAVVKEHKTALSIFVSATLKGRDGLKAVEKAKGAFRHYETVLARLLASQG